ncbi:hypothetical protein Rxycam_00272 [Rubrobacter xylanophilus DSM 9941]|nr:hypothetical protein [Rubrobacter xylanophilus]QYJ14476.1 hypothetical protein Rxycam_00272 [Rubrobacter xylanophilus DSM 9941]
MRERLAYGILVAILILLFAMTFAVLGKGEYEPSPEGEHHSSAQIVTLA